jgi:hypothetical protein
MLDDSTSDIAVDRATTGKDNQTTVIGQAAS